MAKKQVKNPTKYKNQYVQKAYDMHHTSSRNSFCGIGYGKVETTVDKKAVAITGAIAATAIATTTYVPTWAQVAWESTKALFVKKP